MNRVQVVTIILANGRKGTFTGQVLVEPDEIKDCLGPVDVFLSPPHELPPEYRTEPLSELLPDTLVGVWKGTKEQRSNYDHR